MPAHRAWRLYFDRSISSQVLGLSQLEFRATAGGADWTNAGVGNAFASATYPDPFFSPAKAFDNGVGEWASPLTNQNNINHWIGWDLGPDPANWKDLAELMIRARADTPAANTQSPKLLRCEWTDVFPGPTGLEGQWTRDWGVGLITSVWASNEVRVFTRPAKSGQPYWRIYAATTPQGQYLAFNEIEFRNALGGSQIATGGTPISSGNFDASHAIAKAFDGVTATGGTDTDTWASDGILPAWGGYQLAAADTVRQARIWPRDDAPNHNQAPEQFSLDTGADGVSWVVVAEWHTVPWAAGVPVVVTVPEDDRLTLPKVAGGVLIGGVDARLMITKLAPDAVIGGRTDMVTASKLAIEVLEGALPQRIAISKLAAEALEGALPQRITFSKLAVELLLAAPTARRNPPVQIIGG